MSPPQRAVITNTFVKVRQEPKDPTPEQPYGSSIAYRELVHHDGEWRWAFDISQAAPDITKAISRLSRHVNYIGKRGSFVQFSGLDEVEALDDSFTQPLEPGATWSIPRDAQILQLDDFGPEAELDVLSSFSAKRAQRGKHRRFVDTIVPLRVVSTGPGFTDYQLST